ncbi:hypothetical protein CO683_14740 [Bradyrhizobium ottawaense]|uniref:phytanoyl-CoA dioxygenase family protein n=1 Tax=Bradyrhizobium ottawaense TaxID=931866 RepID=UPI000BE9AA3D|nr:phytanoyl-CoA dioxygenase family protein [Bradyrhizobium ottawaense]PDT69218.1 hypothetical protein CO683_14740 [Bradyrhizobium ottawaense]
MFAKEFAGISTSTIVDEIGRKGYFKHTAAIDHSAVDAMVHEFGPNRVAVNHHGISPVCFGRTWYLNQVLAQSKLAFDLITSDKVLDIGEGVLGEEFRLTTKRYYTTREGARMAWHRDNKDDPERTSPLNGLIFIFYLTDVTEGAFQFVEGSHLFDAGTDKANFSDEYIAEKFADKIITYTAPRGAFIVYDIRTIHRAKPFSGIDYERSSLFFGMMSEPTLSEPVLINTSFFDSLDDRRKYYLGFGKREIAPAFPTTSVKTMDDQNTAKVLQEVSDYGRSIGIHLNKDGPRIEDNEFVAESDLATISGPRPLQNNSGGRISSLFRRKHP